ncbi:MAG: LPS export ABC transporter ATP-binding protein [Desulfuromonas sp.]|nr:MAG: LPS export ABC transporter ATP-binding protein [Desulfuromonas sp.]
MAGCGQFSSRSRSRTSVSRQLRATGLHKSYSGRPVVTGVDLEVRSGEVIGLLGPNGAGKTTSFYMVVGLASPDQGHVFLDEMELTDLPMYRRAKAGISYLPQEASVFRKMSVAENLLAILETLQLSSGERQQRLERLLKDFRIEHIRDSKGYALSGGERRRVEIARSLVLEPAFLLLDEPFAGIDPIAVIDIQNIIKDLRQRGIGVLISDHNVRETLGVCDQAYILNRGEVLEYGTPEQIAESPKAREIYLGEKFRL